MKNELVERIKMTLLSCFVDIILELAEKVGISLLSWFIAMIVGGAILTLGAPQDDSIIYSLFIFIYVYTNNVKLKTDSSIRPTLLWNIGSSSSRTYEEEKCSKSYIIQRKKNNIFSYLKPNKWLSVTIILVFAIYLINMHI